MLIGDQRCLYRYEEDAEERPDRDMDLRDAIQRIALEWPRDGGSELPRPD